MNLPNLKTIMKSKSIILVLAAFLLNACVNEFEGEMTLNIRNETDSESSLQLFTMLYTEKLDSLTLTIDSKQETSFKYEPKKARTKSDWILATSTNSRRFGYFPISLEKENNTYYFKILPDTILVSQNKEGFW
jgi:hypothetical protein